MNRISPKHRCILAIAPSTKGFGFVVLEGQETLVDWGVKTVKGNKNAQSVAKVKKLITQYQPGILVLEDASSKGSRRSSRVQSLNKQIVKTAATLKVRTKLFSRGQVIKTFFADGKGTKHMLAELMSNRFPEQLGLQLPPKRKPWMSEDSRMGTFDAVALAIVFRLKKV